MTWAQVSTQFQTSKMRSLVFEWVSKIGNVASSIMGGGPKTHKMSFVSKLESYRVSQSNANDHPHALNNGVWVYPGPIAKSIGGKNLEVVFLHFSDAWHAMNVAAAKGAAASLNQTRSYEMDITEKITANEFFTNCPQAGKQLFLGCLPSSFLTPSRKLILFKEKVWEGHLKNNLPIRHPILDAGPQNWIQMKCLDLQRSTCQIPPYPEASKSSYV